ncbi:MAG TPA: hypothetical protein VN764_18515, partial [Polyangiaceae bacterium]|nr:hypothetical protein [Polyangiaceae bacterium]
DSAREVIIEKERIGGRWMSNDPDEGSGRVALGDGGHGGIIELTLGKGEEKRTYVHRGLPVNDVNFPFMLRRRRTRDRKKVRWTAYVLRDLLPDLKNLTDEQLGTLNFRVLAKGMFEDLSPPKA